MTAPMTTSRARYAALLTGVALVVGGVSAAAIPTLATAQAQQSGIVGRIVATVGRRIDESSPMVDARLPDGSRVN